MSTFVEANHLFDWAADQEVLKTLLPHPSAEGTDSTNTLAVCCLFVVCFVLFLPKFYRWNNFMSVC